MKKLLLGFIALMVWGMVGGQPDTAEAASPNRRNNPYASFNVHGINYASQVWAQNNKSGTTKKSTGKRLFFRR